MVSMIDKLLKIDLHWMSADCISQALDWSETRSIFTAEGMLMATNAQIRDAAARGAWHGLKMATDMMPDVLGEYASKAAELAAQHQATQDEQLTSLEISRLMRHEMPAITLQVLAKVLKSAASSTASLVGTEGEGFIASDTDDGTVSALKRPYGWVLHHSIGDNGLLEVNFGYTADGSVSFPPK